MWNLESNSFPKLNTLVLTKAAPFAVPRLMTFRYPSGWEENGKLVPAPYSWCYIPEE